MSRCSPKIRKDKGHLLSQGWVLAKENCKHCAEPLLVKWSSETFDAESFDKENNTIPNPANCDSGDGYCLSGNGKSQRSARGKVGNCLYSIDSLDCVNASRGNHCATGHREMAQNSLLNCDCGDSKTVLTPIDMTMATHYEHQNDRNPEKRSLSPIKKNISGYTKKRSNVSKVVAKSFSKAFSIGAAFLSKKRNKVFHPSHIMLGVPFCVKCEIYAVVEPLLKNARISNNVYGHRQSISITTDKMIKTNLVATAASEARLKSILESGNSNDDATEKTVDVTKSFESEEVDNSCSRQPSLSCVGTDSMTIEQHIDDVNDSMNIVRVAKEVSAEPLRNHDASSLAVNISVDKRSVSMHHSKHHSVTDGAWKRLFANNSTLHKSAVFKLVMKNLIPKFSWSEVSLGSVLGQGEFGVVREVKSITLHEEMDDECSNDDDDHEPSIDRAFISKRCIRNGEARYALKMIRPDLSKEPEIYNEALIDLAIETRFLAIINHPNIIKIRAMSSGDPVVDGHFIVLDRLYDTLEDRLVQWKDRSITKSNTPKNYIIRKLRGDSSKRVGCSEDEFWRERLAVAYDLAGAMNYLHSLKIMHRDLKPDNIGFDVRGDVKVFDFGLAKEVLYEDRVEEDLYRLSGNCGSLRYMAPEVALDHPYNLKADVYSFGVLLWQVCSLQNPFQGFNLHTHVEHVVIGGYRPQHCPAWSAELKNLIDLCWSKNIPERPCFQIIGQGIREEICRGFDESPDLDISSRSKNSLAGLL